LAPALKYGRAKSSLALIVGAWLWAVDFSRAISVCQISWAPIWPAGKLALLASRFASGSIEGQLGKVGK